MSQWLQHALVCACLLCLSLAPASAEDPDRDYLLDIWGTDDGLPSATVTGITQTRDGYLWCSTHDGAVRFDGVRFLRIGPDEPADQDANRVLCLHADRRGPEAAALGGIPPNIRRRGGAARTAESRRS